MKAAGEMLVRPAAAELIRRVLPEYADRFEVRMQDAEETEEKRKTATEWYAVYAENGKIIIEGNTPVSQARGFYEYLKKYCRVNLSWCGNRELEIRDIPIPGERIEGRILQKYRSYMNYCTFAYSAAGWNWDRWEKEIDFMAMNGINMPLAIIGTEAAWYETLRAFGFTEEEALGYISGPAYWPWHLMTNIDSFLPPESTEYLKQRLELGRKILTRERELGMMPVMQGYSGHIPRKMKEKYPELFVIDTPSWCGFPPTCQLDPADPMFARIGKNFLENQDRLLGNGCFLSCDPFYENVPPEGKDRWLERMAEAIDGLYRAFSETSVWVMQSWSIYKEIVTAIPKGRLLVLDINGHRFRDTDGFWGHDFIIGDISNFGGKNSLHGDIRMLAGYTHDDGTGHWEGRDYEELKKEWPGLCGEGLYMEGINQNPMYYEMGYEHLTRAGKTDVKTWIADYARRRYGRSRREDAQALELLAKTCYAPGTSDCERGSVICARPDLGVRCAAPNDVIEQRYDNRELLKVLDLLLEDTAHVKDGYLFDICDLTRQLLSNHARVLCSRLSDAVRRMDKAGFCKEKASFLNLILELDMLLSTREELRLSRWVKRAEDLGRNEKEKEYYRKNVLTLVTVWGPTGVSGYDPKIFDYAWREWGGLLKEYYYKRWKFFLDEVEEHFDTYPTEHDPDVQIIYNRCAFRANGLYERMAELELGFIDNYRIKYEETGRDTLTEAKRLVDKYRSDILSCGGGIGENGKKAALDFWDENRKEKE